MATDLTRIGEKARKEPGLVFTSLYHHISDGDNLRACYDTLEAGKATGVDGVTKREYGKNLEENLRELSEKLKRMGYRPAPKRRSYVPKPGSAKGRPLGISNLEDKIVELAVKRTLEPIYEAVFEDSSHGYRPGRSQHQCLEALGRTIQQKKVSHVVEADVRSFFDRVNHEWLVKFLRHRIADERVIRLIIRMLKSGIMEDGLVRATEEGTPQGSIVSPLLSNIYLHYVLDLWFSKRVSRQCRGEAYYFRFADDFLACFEHKSDAEDFHRRKLFNREGIEGADALSVAGADVMEHVQDLRDIFVDKVLATKDLYRLDDGELEIEITESTMVQQKKEVIEELQLIQNAGISIALDDFGTGYSSLSQLNNFLYEGLMCYIDCF
mgnify:CR=1 FL=1